jgi:hypothetical protein
VMRIFRPMASSFKCKRSVAEPSGWQRGRAGGRNREVLFDLARQAPGLDHTGGAQLDG